MPIASSLLEDLRTLLPSAVREREGRPVVSPTTTEEASTTLRFANTHNLAVEIAGAGTKRSWPNPIASDILLDTTRLTGLRQHSWQDLTATVASGTPWSTLQQALAAHGQFIALDPLWPTRATVGGILATNDSGPLRLRYGSLRDLVIGMTIVLADGTIARSGGRVVKNVAGYDLHKLMIGAYGTLGLITEVTFRLHPLPLHTQTFTITSTSAESLGNVLLEILRSNLSVQSMQMRASAEMYSLDIRLSTVPEALVTQSEILNRIAASIPAAIDTDPPIDPFQSLQKLFMPENEVVIKATMQPTSIATISMDIIRLGGTAVTQATGIMIAAFSEKAAAEALPSLYGYVDAAGDGSLTLLRVPRPLPEWAVPPWGVEKAPFIMQELKRRFDPNRTLNPGALLGGI